MTCECIIALVTCVATIITTVIAVLSYLKDKKELKSKAAFSVFDTRRLYRYTVETTDRIGHFFLLIYHQLAFSSNRLQVTHNKKLKLPPHN